MQQVGCVQDGGDRVFEGKTEKAPKVSETWLVLEYCSKGSLQDALDRYLPMLLSKCLSPVMLHPWFQMMSGLW